jgi:hypothetical protein
VRRVELALARPDGRRCRWWDARKRRPGKRAACGKPRWMRAELTRKRAGVYEWRLALRRRLTDGEWRLLVRATDSAGNTATRVPGRRSARLRLHIKKGRASLR